MAVKNQVQLITYPDSLGGNLQTLNTMLRTHFADICPGGVHILPPFPSSGDRGFAPLTYLEIEPKFGTWEDIREIGEQFDVLLDLMVNHISRQSAFFQDFLKKGRASEYADLFITLDKLWPDGTPKSEDLSKIFLRRTHPYSTFTIEATGQKETVWTTFGKHEPSEQIDMDMNSAMARKLLADFLVNFSRNNVKIVRLDAVGYIVKKLGTSCFFVKPEIYQFLDWITELAHSFGLELLPEVHAHYSTQYELAEHGHWIYDFILPYTVLHTLFTRSSVKLRQYLKERPQKQFTMLDCHDGVPVKPDMNGLYASEDAKAVVETCLKRGSNLSRVFSPAHQDPDGFDVHQIRGTYYSMLDGNDDAYLAARAIQFFTPGIPQVYYVGLLAGKNDEENIKATGDGREINRHNFSVAEIETALQQEVVQRLLKLIRFRNEYPAFNGDFALLDSDDREIALRWTLGETTCQLYIELTTYQATITYTAQDGTPQEYRI
ncbi:sucrose phosphorylase [Candidatus Moduliflexus flocculans]|uniref:Sucrose phosphorylase n=1 Tax=Candidatus Moduliflexus flocculans TaxID=1499966 RepID=A0A081BR42_9BACT|nr:sucrose phosphorylase [Candidatus Moduliflexus flocculans]